MNFRNRGPASDFSSREVTRPDQYIVLTDADLEEVVVGEFESEDTAVRQVDLTQEAVTRVLTLDETKQLLTILDSVSNAA